MTCGTQKQVPEGFTKILGPSFQQLIKHCTLHPTHPETHPPRHKPCPQSKSQTRTRSETGGTSEGKLACLPCLMPQRLHTKRNEKRSLKRGLSAQRRGIHPLNQNSSVSAPANQISSWPSARENSPSFFLHSQSKLVVLVLLCFAEPRLDLILLALLAVTCRRLCRRSLRLQ